MKRYGFTLIEISAAIVLLAVGAFLLMQLIALTASERAHARVRQTAIDQVQNVLAHLDAVAPEKLIAGDFDKTAAEALVERALPEGQIEFSTSETNSESILWTVTVSWNDGEERPRGEVAMFRLFTLKKQ